MQDWPQVGCSRPQLQPAASQLTLTTGDSLNMTCNMDCPLHVLSFDWVHTVPTGEALVISNNAYLLIDQVLNYSAATLNNKTMAVEKYRYKIEIIILFLGWVWPLWPVSMLCSYQWWFCHQWSCLSFCGWTSIHWYWGWHGEHHCQCWRQPWCGHLLLFSTPSHSQLGGQDWRGWQPVADVVRQETWTILHTNKMVQIIE